MSSARDLSTASVSNSPTKIQKKPNPDTLECQLAIHPSEQFVEPHELMVPGSFVLFCSVLFIYWCEDASVEKSDKKIQSE